MRTSLSRRERKEIKSANSISRLMFKNNTWWAVYDGENHYKECGYLVQSMVEDRRVIIEQEYTKKQKVWGFLMERGFILNDFDTDYETAIDNYNFEYDCNNAEDHDDFIDYCLENWK